MPTKNAIKVIVVGLDGSSSSQTALKWAIGLAKGLGSQVLAVHATAIPGRYAEPYGVEVKFHDGWRRTIRAQFEGVWCKPLRTGGVRHRTIMENGRAASVISAVAERHNADVIVVGRRGRGSLAAMFLGSVSHELVLGSKWPVLVIGPRSKAVPTRARK